MNIKSLRQLIEIINRITFQYSIKRDEYPSIN